MKKQFKLMGAVGISAFILTLLLVGLVSAATVTIDSFDNGLQNLTADPDTNVISESVTASGIIGSERDVLVDWDSGLGEVQVQIDRFGSNRCSFSADSGVEGTSTLTWDGSDGAPGTLDDTGLGGIDLTDGGTNDGVQLLVYSVDRDFDLTISVYSGTAVASYTLPLRDPIASPGQSFFVAFSDFSGAGTVFTSTGAIVFYIDPQETDVDLTIDLLEATAQTDWGDLPENGTVVNAVARYYTTTAAYDGPRHVYTGATKINLGALIDLEADGFPSDSANGDDSNNFDDEDGIERVKVEDGGAAWETGTGHISATVTGGTGDLYAWFDWNNDGDFDDAGETDSWPNLTVGEHRLTVTVDDSAFDPANALFARFRLVPQGAGNPGYTGETDNGEVEDYYWDAWGPNAVVLSDLEAQPSGFGLAALAIVALLGIGGVGLLLLRRRIVDFVKTA